MKSPMQTRILILLLGVGIGAGASSPAQAIDVEFEKDSRLPVVYINAAVKAGSVTDPPGQSGLTNFMSEMLLRGTKLHTKEQIDLALDQLGAKLEVETRAESLILRGAVLSTQLDSYLNLVTEIITQPIFPEKEVKKLKSEVISTIQEELGHDSSLVSRKFNQFLFGNHPYSKSINGKIKDVENLNRDQILAHYNRLIQEQSLLVVGTGDSEPDKISTWAKTLAKLRPNLKIASSSEKELDKVKSPQNPESRRLLIVDKPDRTQTQINLGQVGVKMSDPDFFPLYLGNYSFGGNSFSSTLMVEIRVKRGWSYGVNSAFRQGLQPRSWNIHLYPAAKDTPAALAYSIKLVEELKAKGLTAEQFSVAQESVVNSSGFMYNTPQKRVENTLLEKTLNLPEGFMKSFGPKVNKLRLDEVNLALKKFLKPDQTAIVVVGTAKDLKAPLAKAAGVPLDQVEVMPYTAE